MLQDCFVDQPRLQFVSGSTRRSKTLTPARGQNNDGGHARDNTLLLEAAADRWLVCLQHGRGAFRGSVHKHDAGAINLIIDSKNVITMGHFGWLHVSVTASCRPALRQILQVTDNKPPALALA
jgi:hypothetical protein